MDIIRLATEEEIQKISENSDLSYATSVLSFGGKDFAVLRNCFEIDPFHFAEDTTVKRMLLFAMNIETSLRLQGVKEVYFNVAARDTKFQEVLDTWGAVSTSKEPEIRYKKVL